MTKSGYAPQYLTRFPVFSFIHLQSFLFFETKHSSSAPQIGQKRAVTVRHLSSTTQLTNGQLSSITYTLHETTPVTWRRINQPLNQRPIPSITFLPRHLSLFLQSLNFPSTSRQQHNTNPKFHIRTGEKIQTQLIR